MLARTVIDPWELMQSVQRAADRRTPPPVWDLPASGFESGSRYLPCIDTCYVTARAE